VTRLRPVTAEEIARLKTGGNSIGPDTPAPLRMVNAAELLSGEDPGPPPALIEPLLLEREVAEIIGLYKVSKTWTVCEFSISIVTGHDAFGRFKVRKRGPVMLVVEESGLRALHRRLAMLTRGHGIKPKQLADLHLSANQRLRLDQAGDRERLMAAAIQVRPVAIFLDPMVRLKGAADENNQKEMAPILDGLRHLREETGATIVYVQHTGHTERDRARGTSDFEAYWETRIRLERDRKTDTVTLTADHREAEADAPFQFRLDYDPGDESMRLQTLDRDAERDMRTELIHYVEANPGLIGEDIARGVGRSKADTLARLKSLKDAAYKGRTLRQVAEPRTDSIGRPYDAGVWKVDQWAAEPLPQTGDMSSGTRGTPAEDVSSGRSEPAETPAEGEDQNPQGNTRNRDRT
jgi:hypothetical protein